jgi:hypothetical protein
VPQQRIDIEIPQSDRRRSQARELRLYQGNGKRAVAGHQSALLEGVFACRGGVGAVAGSAQRFFQRGREVSMQIRPCVRLVVGVRR